MRYGILFLSLWVVLVGCGKEDTSSLTYTVEENGCNSGKHTFGSREEYCAGLKDEALNNSCAQGSRRELFKNHDCGDWE